MIGVAMAAHDPALWQKIYGEAYLFQKEKELDEPKRGKIHIIETSQWMCSCDCIDFGRHTSGEQTVEEIEKRMASNGIEILSIEEKYGVKYFHTETDGKRKHVVMMSRGGGDQWVCKHILKVLNSISEVTFSGGEDRVKVNNLFIKEKEWQVS